MLVLTLTVVLAAGEPAPAEASSAYDAPARFGVTLLGAAVGIAAPMLAGLAAGRDCPNGPGCSIGLAGGGAVGTVLSGPLLGLLAHRLASGRGSVGTGLISGWLALFPSMPLTGAGAILAATGLAPQWATSALLAAGAAVAALAIALLLENSHRSPR